MSLMMPHWPVHPQLLRGASGTLQKSRAGGQRRRTDYERICHATLAGLVAGQQNSHQFYSAGEFD